MDSSFSSVYSAITAILFSIEWMLLKKGAKPFIKDYQGNNALFYLKEHANDVTTELISRSLYTRRIDFPIFLRYPLHAKDQFEEFLNEYNPKVACAICKRPRKKVFTKGKIRFTCQRCKWCKTSTYCSRKCQKLHWKQKHGKRNYIMLDESNDYTLVRCIDKHKRHVAYIPKSKIPPKYRNSTSGTVALKVCFVYKILRKLGFKNRLSEKPVTQIFG